MSPLWSSEPHPRFFPYPMRFKEYRAAADPKPEWTEFEYIDTPSADPINVTFITKVKSDQKLVMRFVEKYGMEAHQLLADAEMAPDSYIVVCWTAKTTSGTQGVVLGIALRMVGYTPAVR